MNRCNMIFGSFYILNMFHIPAEPITQHDITELQKDDNQLADVLAMVTGDMQKTRDKVWNMSRNEFNYEQNKNLLISLEKGLRMIVNAFDNEIYTNMDNKKSSISWNIENRVQVIKILNYYIALFIDVIIPTLRDEWKVEI